MQLLSGWQEPIYYKVLKKNFKRQNNTCKISPNFVLCNLRGKKIIGRVLQVSLQLSPTPKFAIKFIEGDVEFPTDPAWWDFIQKLTVLFGVSENSILKKLLPFLEKTNVKLNSSEKKQSPILEKQKVINRLTEKQKSIDEIITEQQKEQKIRPILLHGITGSGKSQIYLSQIISQLQLGKSVIFLVPEVTLASNFYSFFSKELPWFKSTYTWHSAEVSKKSKACLWSAITSGEPVLIIGVHLPIYLPVPNLGLIIVDEEHEESFLEKESPRLNSKQLALLRAQIKNIPIILGSATPNISSYYLAQTGKWHYHQLNERYLAQLAKVEIEELNYTKRPFWLTEKLKSKLQKCFSQGEQALVFLNRRGFAPVVKCSSCKESFSCKNCSVNLVYHKEEVDFLECHYCGHTITAPLSCPCGSDKNFIFKGLGTSQVVQVLSQIYPNAKILQADKTTTKKKSWGEDIQRFAAGEFDLLVGTKCITKGYHFPKVTLVSMIWADLDFSFPNYSATEQALQQMLQVSGRSGRGTLPGEVLLQAFDPTLFSHCLRENMYSEFLQQELETRKMFGYPPFSKIIFIQTKDISEDRALQQITKILQIIEDTLEKHKINLSILGPAKPLIFQKKRYFYWHLMIKVQKGGDLEPTLKMLSQIQKNTKFDFWLET